MSGYSSQYISQAHSSCARLGCQYAESIRCLQAAQQVLNESKKGTGIVPAQSLWCEQKEHPFSSKNGYAEMTLIVKDGDGVIIREEQVTMCIPHTPKSHEEPEAITNGDVVDAT